MTKFAITPKGIGKPVGMRMIEESWIGSGKSGEDLAPGEFVVDDFGPDDVLAADGVSLRTKTRTEHAQEKISELKAKARGKFLGYKQSDRNIDGSSTVAQADLDAYKTALTTAFNTAKTTIQAETDIAKIRNYNVNWPEPV